MAARGEAQADAEVSTLVVPAWRLRWRAPELALVLGERAVALAAARRDEVDRLRAEYLVVFASNRMGRGVRIADRALDALKAAEAEAEHETAWRLRVELADSARSAGAPLTGFAAVRPVLEADGVPDALRASALVQAGECLVSVGRGAALAEALAEADRLYTTDPVLDHDTSLLMRGLLRAAAAGRHRRWGDLDAAIAAGREGFELLDQLTDPTADSGQVRGRLTVELVCALMDANHPAEASETGTPFLDRPVRAPSAASAGWLRLALATRVHLPAGRVDQARDLLRDAADSAERHQLDTLLAESLLALAHVHELAGDLTEALTDLRSAHAAERRRARAVYAVRARLAAEFSGVHPRPTSLHEQLTALLRRDRPADPGLTPETRQQLRQWRPAQVHRADTLRVKRSRRAAEDMTVEGISAARAHAADRWRLVQPFGEAATPDHPTGSGQAADAAATPAPTADPTPPQKAEPGGTTVFGRPEHARSGQARPANPHGGTYLERNFPPPPARSAVPQFPPAQFPLPQPQPARPQPAPPPTETPAPNTPAANTPAAGTPAVTPPPDDTPPANTSTGEVTATPADRGERSVSAAGLIAAAGTVRSGRRRAAREAAAEAVEEQPTTPRGSDGGSVLETLKAAGLLDPQRAGGRRRAPDTEEGDDHPPATATTPAAATPAEHTPPAAAPAPQAPAPQLPAPQAPTPQVPAPQATAPSPAAPSPTETTPPRTNTAPAANSPHVGTPPRVVEAASPVAGSGGAVPAEAESSAVAKPPPPPPAADNAETVQWRVEPPAHLREGAGPVDMFDSPTMVQPAIRDEDAPLTGLGAAFVKGPVIPTARVPEPPDFSGFPTQPTGLPGPGTSPNAPKRSGVPEQPRSPEWGASASSPDSAATSRQIRFPDPSDPDPSEIPAPKSAPAPQPTAPQPTAPEPSPVPQPPPAPPPPAPGQPSPVSPDVPDVPDVPEPDQVPPVPIPDPVPSPAPSGPDQPQELPREHPQETVQESTAPAVPQHAAPAPAAHESASTFDMRDSHGSSSGFGLSAQLESNAINSTAAAEPPSEFDESGSATTPSAFGVPATDDPADGFDVPVPFTPPAMFGPPVMFGTPDPFDTSDSPETPGSPTVATAHDGRPDVPGVDDLEPRTGPSTGSRAVEGPQLRRSAPGAVGPIGGAHDPVAGTENPHPLAGEPGSAVGGTGGAGALAPVGSGRGIGVGSGGFLGRADVEDDEPEPEPEQAEQDGVAGERAEREPAERERAAGGQAEPEQTELGHAERRGVEWEQAEQERGAGGESADAGQEAAAEVEPASHGDSGVGAEGEPFVTSVVVGGRAVELPAVGASPSANRASRRPKSELSLAELLAEALVAYETGRREDEAARGAGGSASDSDVESTGPIPPVGAGETSVETTTPIPKVTGEPPAASGLIGERPGAGPAGSRPVMPGEPPAGPGMVGSGSGLPGLPGEQQGVPGTVGTGSGLPGVVGEPLAGPGVAEGGSGVPGLPGEPPAGPGAFGERPGAGPVGSRPAVPGEPPAGAAGAPGVHRSIGDPPASAGHPSARRGGGEVGGQPAVAGGQQGVSGSTGEPPRWTLPES
ncbi:hypothetical protein [Saccharothrix obliqua]|uniref:hypothetical protein n=1 Tax=Saccharothrix obliqua TaxID=2861747 RepID=UPI001C5D7D2B|nr:hypothetical protein [Saccharothrix obliqua]MBW4720794.1 hypothetical protein [Saccharothrix obliqua]